MPEIPDFGSPIIFLGISSLFLGIFFILTSQKIINIKQVSPGNRTLISGLFFTTIGLSTLVFSLNSASPSSVTQPSQTNNAPQASFSDKKEALDFYGEIYEEAGWCALWDYLVDEGGVSGECPNPRESQASDNPNGETLIDGFVTKEGDYISAFALQADTTVYINYSLLQCVSFDPTNVSIEYELTNNRYTNLKANGWQASDIKISGPFSLWLRCDGNWE